MWDRGGRVVCLVFANLVGRTLFYLGASRSLLESASAPDTSENVTLLLGHALVIQLAVAWVAAIVGLGLLASGLPRVATASVALVESLAWLFAVVDYKVYRLLGIHLDDPVVLEAIQSRALGREADLGLETWASFAGFACLVGGLQLATFRASSRVGARLRLRVGPLLGAAVALALAGTTLVACAVSERRARARAEGNATLEALPLVETLDERHAHAPRRSFVYPKQPQPITPLRRPSILLILVESLRHDADTPELMPNVARFRAEHSCVRSERHYSGAHTTEYGVFTLLYGLDGHHYGAFAEARTRSWPLAELERLGYGLHGVSASRLRDWNRAGFMLDQLHRYQELLAQPVDAADAAMVDYIESFAASPSAEAPFVLFTFFASPHANYFFPPAFEVDRPVLPADFDYFEDDSVLRERATEIRNRYRNSVRWVDHLFGRVVDAFRKPIEEGRVVVFLSGDHGEELWDHGKLGHAAHRFVEARIRVPLLLCIPGGPPTVKLSGHVDVWPTILHYVQGDPVDAARFSSGRSLYSPASERQLVVTGAGFPDKSRRLAVVTEREKLWLSRKSGAFDRFDLVRATSSDDELLAVQKLDPKVERELARSMRQFLAVRP